MTGNPHFEIADSLKASRAWVTFEPIEPEYTAGFKVETIRIHVLDHKMRRLSADERTLEIGYGAFVFSQAQRGASEARRLAFDVSYGQDGRSVQIAVHAGRAYELGPEPPAHDIDGRMPSVVTWHDGEIFYLLASHTMLADELLRIAASLYK